MTDRPATVDDMVLVPRKVLDDARGYVQIFYDDHGGHEAGRAGTVLTMVDTALSAAPPAPAGELELASARWPDLRVAEVESMRNGCNLYGAALQAFASRTGCPAGENVLEWLLKYPAPANPPTDDGELLNGLAELKAWLLKEAEDHAAFVTQMQERRTAEYKARGDLDAEYRGITPAETQQWAFASIVSKTRAALIAAYQARAQNGWQKGFAPVDATDGEILIAHASRYEASAIASFNTVGEMKEHYEIIPIEYRAAPNPPQEG